MPEPKSTLEKLLAAASQDCTGVQECPACDADMQLMDLTSDMARAGLALADELEVLIGLVGNLGPTLLAGGEASQALATWRKLGEAEEGRGG